MCGKKGHPASACSVKPLSDNDNKLIRSSKLASNAMAAIQKSMKTMGKAMAQISKIADFDDKLFEEQSHAQLGVVSVEAARRLVLILAGAVFYCTVTFRNSTSV
jgi:hypothetical protein